MKTKIINGLEFNYEEIPMDGIHYNRDGLRFQIHYRTHCHFAECYILDYKHSFFNARDLEEVENIVVKSLYFKISEIYDKYEHLNNAVKDIDRNCFR